MQDERETDEAGLWERAASDACLSQTYLVLTVTSCAIATLGLLENSVAVIIGAMLVAPLISPIQSLAHGALDADGAMVRRALLTTVAGVGIAIVLSASLRLALDVGGSGSEILARTRPTILDLFIAIAAGSVAGFARVRPAVSNTVAGTAIAVALMPPLCVVGIALAEREWSYAEGAGLLFGTNFLGIALACMVVYLLDGQLHSRTRFGLIMTSAITVALAIPLGASFFEIVRETRIEAAIRHELVSNTVTFRHARLTGARFDWYAHPLAVRLSVDAEQKLSSAEVRDLEEFVRTRTGQNVALTLAVNSYEVVNDTTSQAPLP